MMAIRMRNGGKGRKNIGIQSPPTLFTFRGSLPALVHSVTATSTVAAVAVVVVAAAATAAAATTDRRLLSSHSVNISMEA